MTGKYIADGELKEYIASPHFEELVKAGNPAPVREMLSAIIRRNLVKLDGPREWQEEIL